MYKRRKGRDARLLSAAKVETRSSKKVEKETIPYLLRVAREETVIVQKKADKETTPLLHSVEEVKSNKEVVEKASIDCGKIFTRRKKLARLFKKRNEYRKNYVV